MYDLNMTVPNLTAQKYSNDHRFLLLKNYLYELNETLSFALSDKTESIIESIANTVEENEKSERERFIKLKNESIERFNQLKEQIIRTAEEIEKAYTTEISQTKEEILQTATEEFVSKSEFGKYRSQTATELSQTADRISAIATQNEEVAADLENHKKTNNARFSVHAKEILSQVESVYSAKTDLYDLEENLSSQISQTAEDITETFSEDLALIEEDLSSVGGEVEELISSLDVYIRRGKLDDDVYGIEIGRSDSKIKARFTNNRLSFYQGRTEVAYISGSNLYITRAEILDYLKIGNTTNGYFTLDVTDNGLEVKWSDGD